MVNSDYTGSLSQFHSQKETNGDLAKLWQLLDLGSYTYVQQQNSRCFSFSGRTTIDVKLGKKSISSDGKSL